MRSACTAMELSWVISTTVCPCLCSCCKSPSTSRPVWESSAPVGSSARITGGLRTSARAMDTRCCWPPESWLGRFFSLSPRPTCSNTSRARACRSARETPAYTSGTSTFSIRFSRGSRLYCWKMKPSISLRTAASSLRLILPTSRPLSRYTPWVGTSRQPMMFMQVDLPEPDWPTMATNSPLSIFMVMWSAAFTVVSPIW